MKLKIILTGIGIVDNLYHQADRIQKLMNRCSYQTRVRYMQAFIRFLRHIGIKYKLQKLQNIQIKHIDSYLQELLSNGRSVKYIKTEISALLYCLNYVPGLRIIPPESGVLNKFYNLDSTPDGRADRAWTTREISEFTEIMQRENKSEFSKVTKIMEITGCRLDEACTVKRHQVEDAIRNNSLKLVNTKGGRPRTVNLDNPAIDTLRGMIKDVPRGEYVVVPKEYCNGRIHLFKSKAQKYLIKIRSRFQDKDRNSTAHNVKNEERGALSAHGLRHMYARTRYDEFIEAGLSDNEARKKVAELLGHGRSSITKIYLSQETK